MEGVTELANNEILQVSLLAWFIAQGIKVITVLIREKRFDFSRFVGSGGMPSSHSALVVSMSTAVGIRVGWSTPLTAISIIVSLIVMYDAAGVRRAAGKQAEILNKIVDDIYLEGALKEERLKELIGHTPKEVMAGALLGLFIAFLWVK